MPALVPELGLYMSLAYIFAEENLMFLLEYGGVVCLCRGILYHVLALTSMYGALMAALLQA